MNIINCLTRAEFSTSKNLLRAESVLLKNFEAEFCTRGRYLSVFKRIYTEAINSSFKFIEDIWWSSGS